MRRFAAVVLILAFACGKGSAAEELKLDGIDEIAEQTTRSARTFEVTSEFGGQEVVVKGQVEDDFRYQAAVSLDGDLVYEERVIDDARYVRLADPTAISSEDLSSLDPVFGPLATGSWVVDPKGAPPEFLDPQKAAVPLGPSLVLGRVRFLEQLPILLKKQFRDYNKLATYYLPKEDKFPEHKDDGKRFDHVPTPYNPEAITVTLESVREFFEYLSIWSQPKNVTRFERLMVLPDPSDETYKEMYKQIKRAGSKSLVSLLASKQGRKFSETYVFGTVDGATIERPANAAVVDLKPALGKLQAKLLAEGGGAVRGPLVGPPA